MGQTAPKQGRAHGRPRLEAKVLVWHESHLENATLGRTRAAEGLAIPASHAIIDQWRQRHFHRSCQQTAPSTRMATSCWADATASSLCANTEVRSM